MKNALRRLLTGVMLPAASILILFSCGTGGHFITDAKYRDQVHIDFEERRDGVAANRSEALFAVMEREDVTLAEREALEFLYAYMPLCDLADCDGEFFLDQVRGAFRARDHFSWGRSVPEDVFRHFVLPHRVNNENMDSARNVFFYELKDRVQGMSMRDAALEVNHWCHEKVEYRGTDPRTSAPLALVRTSWGRCGEESAFTAAAMRAVGIPARQVYTPRWVHTDSNHAWVEVWIDGQWHYMGACEPEPDLDMAWFTSPAKRAMMMHTKVFGRYNGPEEVNTATPWYVTINLLDIYAPVREVEVRVLDQQGNPVEGARVDFKVYNYSEFYPISESVTDGSGTVRVTTGLGDVVAWCSKGSDFGWVKLSKDTNTADVVISALDRREFSEDYVIDVPVEQPAVSVSDEKLQENRIRFAREDSIRNAYMATFPDRAYSDAMARETSLPADLVWKYLHMSQGNWQQIEQFIRYHKGNPFLTPFLGSLLEKDLRDTPAAYLNDHIPPSSAALSSMSMYGTDAFSPRIEMEIISPWKSYLIENVFNKGLVEPDPEAIAAYVRNTIEVASAQNYIACRITPIGVHKLGVADSRSRDIYYVALCRSAGIAARIEKATGKTQYQSEGLWRDVVFDTPQKEASTPVKGRVVLNNEPSNLLKPAYRTHYTLARFEGGDFRTLDLASQLGTDFPHTLSIDTGYYRLMSGSRGNDGSMTVHSEYFNITPEGVVDKKVVLPHVSGKLFVQGIVDMNTVLPLDDGGKATLKELSRGKGLIVVFADPGAEPTRHILQEMPAYTAALEEWGGGVLMLVPSDRMTASFDPERFAGLPSQTVWNLDPERALLNNAAGALNLDFKGNFPLTLYLNTNGGVLYSLAGYRIGIVENLLKTITVEQQTK